MSFEVGKDLGKVGVIEGRGVNLFEDVLFMSMYEKVTLGNRECGGGDVGRLSYVFDMFDAGEAFAPGWAGSGQRVCPCHAKMAPTGARFSATGVCCAEYSGGNLGRSEVGLSCALGNVPASVTV